VKSVNVAGGGGVLFVASMWGLFAQNHRRRELRCLAAHGLVHGVRAKVNAARPFNAAKIGIDGDGVENTGLQQLQKHAAAPFGFNGKNPLQAVAETNLQSMTGQWPR
jgi:hypothetical protein